jgi:hypothetical protein
MTNLLPEVVQERIDTFPECSNGANKVALIMKDGSVIEDVIVAWGNEVVRVGGQDGCPYDADDVVDAEDRSHRRRAPL